MEDWVSVVRRLRETMQYNWTSIAAQMAPYFPDLTYQQVYEKVRHYERIGVVPKVAETKGAQKTISYNHEAPKLIFADVHAPFDHPGFLPFLIDTYKREGCEVVVDLGDRTDQHMFSRFTPEAVAMGALEEYEKACARTRMYFDAFPVGYLCESNHDFRYIRKAAKDAGIPEMFLKSYRELFYVPDAWQIGEEFVLDDVMYMHGEGYSGETGAKRAALDNCMSVCMGHWHGLAGVQYKANARKLFFGMQVGCGIDRVKYAFAYGKHSKDKPILGCGIVYSSTDARFVSMPSSYFRSA
jgi:hypothetical protein